MPQPAPPPGASTFHLPEGPWATVLQCLTACFPAVGEACWIGRFERGRVLDDRGTPLPVDAAYRPQLRVYYFREVLDEPAIPFTETLLHVDEHLVVVDKPHFLPVMPAGRFVEQSVLRRLMHRLDCPHLVPLHRIDRLTAGLVLFSTNPHSRPAYQALFRERRIEKRYLAVAAALAEVPAVRRSRMAPGEPFFRMQEVAGAPNTETRIRLLCERAGVGGYLLEPVTGRKHQLRVHLAALGAPIFNDPLYPTAQAEAEDDYARPLQLLAAALAFDDPITGARRAFQSALQLHAWPGESCPVLIEAGREDRCGKPPGSV